MVILARITGFRRVRFWQGESGTGLIRWYRVPKSRPCLPVPHCFEDPNEDDASGRTGDIPDSSAGVLRDRIGGDRGQAPLWQAQGEHYCGDDEAWLGGGRRGIDAPLVFRRDGSSSCCIPDLEAFMGTPNYLAKFTGAGQEIIDSRVFDNGGPNPVRVAAELLVKETLRFYLENPDFPTALVGHTLDLLSGVLRSIVIGPGIPSRSAQFDVRVDDNDVTADLTALGLGAVASYGINGERAGDHTDLGFDVRGGLVFGVPDDAALSAGLGLGSAAFAATGDFDAAGAAAAAVAAHEAAADPHPQYLIGAKGSAILASIFDIVGGGVAADTWASTDGSHTLPSLSLGPGTWLVCGGAPVWWQHDGTGLGLVGLRIATGTGTPVLGANGRSGSSDDTERVQHVAVQAVLTFASTTTVRLQQKYSGTPTFAAAGSLNSSEFSAYLWAVQVAR